MADATDPVVHITFAVSRQKVHPFGCTNIEHVGVALLPTLDRKTRVNLFTLIQIDLAFQLSTGPVCVIFKEILTGQFARML